MPTRRDVTLTPTTSLSRAFRVLELLGKFPGGLTNSSIARRLDIASSSCTYLLSHMEQEGYLDRDEKSGRYEIGATLVTIGHYVLRNMGVYEITRPTLHRLSLETRLTTGVGILRRDRVLVMDQVESPEFIKRETMIGAVLPVHSTAFGKVLLADRPRSEILALIKKTGLPPLTEYTITTALKFLAEIERVKKLGYATALQEQYVGFRGVAAPITDDEGRVQAAISVVGSITHSIWKRSEEVIELVKSAGREISSTGRFRL
jgi:DNA-binding IclR family transcriptional regulator